MTNINRRPLALADIASLRAVSDPQISPDGRHVAFVVETIDPEANQAHTRIWIADVDAGTPPEPLTAESGQCSQPRWSPDSQALAFVENREGTKQIWVQGPGGAEPRQITRHPLGAFEPAWSPDGQRLAFLALGPNGRGDPLVVPETDDRRRTVRVTEHRHKEDGVGFLGPYRNHVWVADLASGVARQITDGAFDDQSPAWSPDGRQIAFVSDRAADRDQHYGGGAVHVVEIATGEQRRLTPDNERAAHPSWSPDGTRIAHPRCSIPDDSGPVNNHLWIAGLAAGEARCLTAGLDRSAGQSPGGYLTASPPAWSRDGASVFYSIADGCATHLYRVTADEVVPLTAGRLVVQSFSVDRAARRAALLVTDPVMPAEVWLWEDGHSAPSTGERASLRRLSHVNDALVAQLALVHPQDLRLTRPDGTEIDGWLLAPPHPNNNPLPLILFVHGGPHNYVGDTFSFDNQLYAALGFAVLYVNPRGSGGYGEHFARAVCGDWGGKDFEDLMAMLDHVIARGNPPIDDKRLGITGGSYGGFMTCWAITRTSRFAAAVAGACISNLISYFGTSEIGASWNVREFGGPPEERLVWYVERSPVLHAAKVTTPLLLYHGEADLTCAIEQSEQMFAALHRLGKTVEFLRVPTESHGVLGGSSAHRVAGREAIVGWFTRLLQPA
jgi:dipeptidyl aminopeptidase/acylaminoacyl peptidase